MRNRKKPAKAASPAHTAPIVMRLYVAGEAVNSRLARSNLATICKESLLGKFELEVVDVLEEPRRALADGILVTPSLAKVAPRPAATIVGNLSDRSSVIRALGLRK